MTSPKREAQMRILGVLLLAFSVVLTGAIVGFTAVSAQSAGGELANRTVEVQDVNNSIWVDVQFATHGKQVNASLLDPNGTVVNSSTLAPPTGTTESKEWSVNTTGNFTVTVTGNESDVEALYVGVGDGNGTAVIAPPTGGGDSDGSPGFGVIAALLAVLGAGAIGSRRA